MAALPKVLLVVSVLLAPAAARADDAYRVPDELRQRPELPDQMHPSEARPLGLSEAIQIAVQRNLGILLSREQKLATDETIGVALGEFEPTVSAQISHGIAATPPPINLLQNGDQAQQLNTTSDNWNLQVNERLESGTQVSLGFSNLRTFVSPGGSTPLLFNSGLSMQLVQPLLRNFAFDLDVPRADILRARFASTRAMDDVRLAMIATVHATDDAYWDLVQALKDYAVQRESLKLADDQLELTKRHIDSGLLATADLISAESTQAQRQLDLLQAEATIVAATDALRHVLALPREEWGQPILPTDAPPFHDRTVSLDVAANIAEKNRPEISQRQLDVKSADFEVKVAKTNKLPELDAVGNYGLVGQQVAYGSTLNQLFATNVPAWGVGLNLTWAPLMLAARSQLASLRATEDAKRTQLEQSSLDVYAELRDDLRALELGARQVRAAAKFRDLAQQALDAEERKFANGTSSNFIVAQRQADLALARRQELAALIGHRKASTALDAAMGVLLEERGIQLAGPK